VYPRAGHRNSAGMVDVFPAKENWTARVSACPRTGRCGLSAAAVAALRARGGTQGDAPSCLSPAIGPVTRIAREGQADEAGKDLIPACATPDRGLAFTGVQLGTLALTDRYGVASTRGGPVPAEPDRGGDWRR